MKISKLFHWLYTVIMLLPIFAIGVTCVTCFWNKEDSLSIQNKYETNEVNNYLTDLQRGNIYHFKYKELVTSVVRPVRITELYNFSNIEHYSADVFTDTSYTLILELRNNGIQIRNETYNAVIGATITANDLPFEFDIVFYSFDDLTDLSQYIEITQSTFNVVDNIVSESRENVFYRAIDKVQQSPLFNWAENSFLVSPFAYIVSLFSMPANSPIVMFLSYWLAISIIWLVFDLIMYVPLLVHRWLDKGVLE